MKKLPQKFFWGASTSSYQVEGAYDQDGKGLSVQDLTKAKPGITDFKNSVQHYYHWKEDVALMGEMGFKSYRFSISWSRIFPEGTGKINEKGVEFYNNLINELVKHKIEPIVTIYHFDLPLALEKKGGWSNRELIIPAFVNYAKVLFEIFGDRVKYWQTINEQNMMIILGHNIGLFDRNDQNVFKSLYQQNHTMLLAQAKVMILCHKMIKEGKIGPAPNIAFIYPHTDKPEDVDAAYKGNAFRNWLYLDAAVYGEYNQVMWNWLVKNNYQPEIQKGDLEILKQGKPDFIAFNYYSTLTVKAPTKTGKIDVNDANEIGIYDIPGLCDFVRNTNLPKSNFGMEIDPLGLLASARAMNERYHLPLIITENGLGDYDKVEKDGSIHDPHRIDYLKKHIQAIKEINNEGIEIFGYHPWSAIDLVSTHEGIKKRYGFIYVNIDDEGHGDYKRYKKDSFYWYQKVIKSNGENLG